MNNPDSETSIKIPFKGVLFDLDGVITSTDIQHFTAWKRMFEKDAEIEEFSHQDYLEYVDGKKRLDGVVSFLRAKNHQTPLDMAIHLGEIKQQYYLEEIDKGGITVFSSTVDLIRELSTRGVQQAVVSSSRNAQLILQRVELDTLFDVIIGGDRIKTRDNDVIVEMVGKPAPDLFLRACQELKLSPSEVIGIEDALSGIEALQKACIFSIAIDRKNSLKLQNSGADLLVSDLSEVTIEKLANAFQGK